MAHPLTLAGVFAHPDDESWSLAGVFALLVPKGVRGVVWTATRGQAGQIAGDSGATRETLPRVREAEERAAMAAVGVDRVAFGDFVDGQVDGADRDALTAAVHGFLERELPDAPASKLRRFRELGQEAGVDLPGEGDPYGPRGTPDERFTCRVDTSPVAEAAWRALQAHRTQSGDVFYRLLRHRDAWREVFADVAFVRVHPAPRPGDLPETSLVDAFPGGGGG